MTDKEDSAPERGLGGTRYRTDGAGRRLAVDVLGGRPFAGRATGRRSGRDAPRHVERRPVPRPAVGVRESRVRGGGAAVGGARRGQALTQTCVSSPDRNIRHEIGLELKSMKPST